MRIEKLALGLAGALFLSGFALADDGWVTLAGDEIGPALSARHLVYDGGATQQFNADGSTDYESGRPSHGSWRVEGERYCSVWPPSDRWACYRVERSADGLALRFVAEDGSASVGRYDDL